MGMGKQQAHVWNQQAHVCKQDTQATSAEMIQKKKKKKNMCSKWKANGVFSAAQTTKDKSYSNISVIKTIK